MESTGSIGLDAILFIVVAVFGSGGLVSVLLKWITGRLTNSILEIEKSLKALTVAQLEFFKLLATHDAQARGIVTTTGDTQAERDTEALRQYKQVMESYQGLKNVIEASIK